MRILHIKLDHNGISEYKITSKDGCCYKNLMGVTEMIMLREYLELTNNEIIEKLQADNEKLRKCVEFYADIDNWSVETHPNDFSMMISDDLTTLDEPQPKSSMKGTWCGGKLARQTLREVDNV